MMVNLPCLMVSCTNFLRPTCPYTECRLSLFTESCPKEWTTAGYSSCLYLILTDPVCPQKTDCSVDAFLLLLSVGLVAFRTFPCPYVFRFLFRNPARLPNLRNTGRIPEQFPCLVSVFYAACAPPFTGCFISDSIFSGSYLPPFFKSA